LCDVEVVVELEVAHPEAHKAVDDAVYTDDDGWVLIVKLIMAYFFVRWKILRAVTIWLWGRERRLLWSRFRGPESCRRRGCVECLGVLPFSHCLPPAVVVRVPATVNAEVLGSSFGGRLDERFKPFCCGSAF
jgi:hypothetical protein